MDFNFTKAKEFNSKKITLPCLIEEKLDGNRMVLWKGHAYGRNEDCHGYWINKWHKLPCHIQNCATNEPVDGELVVLDGESSDVITAINDKSTALQFVGFRLPKLMLYPHEHLGKIEEMGIHIPRIITHVPISKSQGYSKLSKDLRYGITEEYLLIRAEELKIEGWVLKERCKYPIWWKLKIIKTYDLIIIGFEWPTAGRNKAKGWIKSLCCSAYVNGELKEVAKVSGMTDEVRSNITSKDIGRIIEVKANLLASKGRLRHPRFIRFREDKNANECILTIK